MLEQAAEAVVFTAHDGEMGVLTGRSPLMCELGIGELRYRAGGQTRKLYIEQGFAQVLDNHVTVLTQRAVAAESIDSEMLAAAQRGVDELTGSDPETLEARLQAQRRLRVLQSLHDNH